MNTILVRGRRDESGAVAIIVGLLSVVLLMCAAYAVDIGMQINRRHQLSDTLDAAAQAGAYELPGSAIAARTQALAFAAAHDPSETGSLAPNVDFWCVVASKLTLGVYQPEPLDIPSTCYPGTGPYAAAANYKATGRTVNCSELLCAIPCVEPTPNTATPKVACNTIRVYQGREVPFAFAPAGGIDHGSTGNMISVACKGSCGTVPPNPMDVAVVADRTVSMGDADVVKLVSGIKGMLQTMTPSQQYVSLGTIGRSAQTSTGLAASKNCTSSDRGLTYGSTTGAQGLWMPIAFSNDYVDSAGALAAGSTLVKGVNCIGAPTPKSDAYQGTVLAAPMKAAAKYILGTTPNNLGSLPPRNPTPRKVIIFETDGQPNERQPTAGDASLTSGDVYSHPLSLDAGVTTTQLDQAGSPQTTSTTITTMVTHRKTVAQTYNGGLNACNNLINVAANAKAQGILVIMIGYNMFENGTPKRCYDYDGVKDDYSNLNLASPASSIVNTSTSSTVANPAERTDVQCPAPNATKRCITNYQTTTTTTTARASSSATVLSVMAQAASPTTDVDGSGSVPSAAESTCSTPVEQTAENSDGDFLFCAASGTEMAPIFRTALSQASKGIRLIRLP